MSDINGKSAEEIKMTQQEWEEKTLKKHLEAFPETKPNFVSDGGVPIERTYTSLDMEKRGLSYLKDISFPGKYPFTRGINPNMYRSIPWPIAQYGGFGTAEETNQWFKKLIGQGAQRLGLALDLVTQLGYDSDHPMAKGEIGKVGVAVNSLRDMEIIYNGIPLNKYGNSIVANSIGPVFLALYIALAEKQGIAEDAFQIFLQNDVLKEYVARGTYIVPPRAGVKLCGDVVEYVVKHNMQKSSPIWFCGYHYKESGASTVQEIAFPIANGKAYIEDLYNRGITLDDFGSRVMWNMTAGIDFFEDIAKYRALRRLWARVATEELGAKNPASVAVRVASFTAGSGFTAQQPLINIVRGCIGGMAAVLGGCQNLVISGFDEALSIPSEEAMKVSLRTQQIMAEESRIGYTADPLGGSYFIECLTYDLEQAAREVLQKEQTAGGAVAVIGNGWIANEIAHSAYQRQQQLETGDRVMVGANKFQSNEPSKINVRKPNPRVEEEQLARLHEVRRVRDNREVKTKLHALQQAARENQNTVKPILEALKEYATLGEICSVLRDVYGEYTAK